MPPKRLLLVKFAGELIVPLLMVGFVLAYWWQAASLSASAVFFPMMLTIALIAMLFIQIGLSLRAIVLTGPNEAPVSAHERPHRRWWMTALQRLVMIALAAGLFMYWRTLGGTVVIYTFILGTLIMLGERRWTVLLPMPAALAVVLTYLFKVVLRVRFPDGLLPLF